MIKYTDIAIGFREVPGETSLLINISNCPYRCPGCHTSYLQQDTGEELTEEAFIELLNKHEREITCVCFLGEGNDLAALDRLVDIASFRGILTCLYTGGNNVDYYATHLRGLNFIKVGPYVAELGGLDSPTTNQRLYEVQWRGDTNGDEWYLLNDMTHLCQGLGKVASESSE